MEVLASAEQGLACPSLKGKVAVDAAKEPGDALFVKLTHHFPTQNDQLLAICTTSANGG